MGNSLQDQLLKAGLVDAKQLKKARAEKRAGKGGKKGRARGVAAADPAARRRVHEEKVSRDRTLNERRAAESERKAIRAEIREMVRQHRLRRDDGEHGFNFLHGKTVRKIYVTEPMRAQLVAGTLAIVTMGERYEVVPADVAEKIRTRDPSRVVGAPETTAKPADDDPYADHPVPDDLMW